LHGPVGQWSERVDAFVTPSEFTRSKFIEAGLPSEKVFVKPNFVGPDPGARDDRETGHFFLFVGRLSIEKGVDCLLEAFARFNRIKLLVVGDGPCRSDLERVIAERELGNVSLLGNLSPNEIPALMMEARGLIMPSIAYETFGRVGAEAFSCGLPVLAARRGALEELVDEHRTGLLFEPGNAEALSQAVAWAWDHPDEMRQMGRTARLEFNQKYTADKNYETMLDIYRAASSLAGAV